MGTTLWWSEEDRLQKKPEALVATGQYNICWNLLEFIYRLRRNSENLSPDAQVIIDLQEELEEDWKRFKENPMWMYEKYFSERHEEVDIYDNSRHGRDGMRPKL